MFALSSFDRVSMQVFFGIEPSVYDIISVHSDMDFKLLSNN